MVTWPRPGSSTVTKTPRARMSSSLSTSVVERSAPAGTPARPPPRPDRAHRGQLVRRGGPRAHRLVDLGLVLAAARHRREPLVGQHVLPAHQLGQPLPLAVAATGAVHAVAP